MTEAQLSSVEPVGQHPDGAIKIGSHRYTSKVPHSL